MFSSIFLGMALQQQGVFPRVGTGMTLTSAPAHRVAPGDTLSRIAPSMGESWQQLYAANRTVIGADPDLIYPGEILHAGSPAPAAADYTSRTVKQPAHPQSGGKTRGVTYGYPYYCGDGDGDGWDTPCSALHRGGDPAPARQAPARQASRGGYQSVMVNSSHVSTAGFGSFQACVITRESGGNPQVMNSSSHYGLYQFDYGTWVSGGGNGADFGHASVAEQNRVFANVYAARGTEPWSPSDHC